MARPASASARAARACRRPLPRHTASPLAAGALLGLLHASARCQAEVERVHGTGLHAEGASPTATRSGQPVHFVALPVTSFLADDVPGAGVDAVFTANADRRIDDDGPCLVLGDRLDGTDRGADRVLAVHGSYGGPTPRPAPSSTGGSIDEPGGGVERVALPRGRSFQSLPASTHWRQPMHLAASNRMLRGRHRAVAPPGRARSPERTRAPARSDAVAQERRSFGLTPGGELLQARGAPAWRAAAGRSVSSRPDRR